MANYERWTASLTVRDGANRPSTMQWYVPKATAQLYFAAADKSARDATAIGILFAKALAVTAGAEETRSVTVVDESAPVTIPSETVLRGNKLVIGFAAEADQYQQTVPARDATAYTPKADSIEVDFAASGDLADYITAFQATAIGKNGGSVTVNKAYVND
jgi:hypothetical protein